MPDVSAAPRATGSGSQGPDAIRVEHISKRFGAVTALTDVNLHLGKGEILGLIGDNGAGKSTFIKILTGFQPPDGGRMSVNGQEVHLRSVDQARALGIETVYQDLALVPELSIYHNLFLKRELRLGPTPFLDNARMRREAQRLLDDIGVRIPSVTSTVAQLSGGQRQAIAIARAVHSSASILLLDEPLAAMGAKEGALIMNLIERLRADRGVSVLMIDHNYAHVLQICDRVNVLQHGEVTFDRLVKDTSAEELTELMVAEYRERLLRR